MATTEALLKFWIYPAVHPDLQSNLEDKKWTLQDPVVDLTPIFARSIAVFIISTSLGLCLRRLSPWISKVTHLQTGGNVLYGLLAIAGASYCFYHQETRRAESAAHELLIDHFETIPTVDKEILDYLASSPAAVEMLCQKEMTPVLVVKLHELLSCVLEKHPTTKSKNHVQVFNTLIDCFAEGLIPIPQEILFLLVNQDDPYFATYAFSKEVIKNFPNQLDVVVACWNLVNSDALAEVLITHRYSINTINSKGISPLLQATKDLLDPSKNQKQAFSKFYRLLKYGAFIENLMTPIVKVEGQSKQISVSDWLEDRPEILKALKQAQKLSSNDPYETYSEIETVDPFSFTIWKPAVQISPTVFKMNFRTLIARTTFVALITLSGVAVTLVKTKLSSKLPISNMISVLALLPFLAAGIYGAAEWIRAARYLSEVATHRFKKTRFHEPSITPYISSHPSLIETLITEKKCDLSKQDASGNTLLKAVVRGNSKIHQDNFNALVKHLESNNWVNNEMFEHFLSTLKTNNLEYTSLFFMKSHFAQLARTRQFECWISCRSESAISLLTKHRFDINVKNEKGLTPLFYIAALLPEAMPSQTTLESFSKHDFIKTLLTIKNIELEPTKPNEKRIEDLLTLPQDQSIKALIIQQKLNDKRYLASLLESQSIQVTDLTDEQQFQCWEACRAREAIQLLIGYRFNIESKNQEGFTPLLYVASLEPREWKLGWMAALLDAGADPFVQVTITSKDIYGKTTTEVKDVLSFLDEKERQEIKPLINDKKTDIVNQRLKTFCDALENNKKPEAKQLLQTRSILVELLTEEQQFQCWLACRDSEALDLLSQYKFNIEAKNKEGLTPLFYGVTHSCLLESWGLSKVDFIKAFIGAKASPTLLVKNADGEKGMINVMNPLTPDEKKEIMPFMNGKKSFIIKNKLSLFCSALENNKIPEAEQLLSTKLIKKQALQDPYPFQCWLACRTREAIQLLYKYGFNTEAKNEKGYTPLLYVISLPSSSVISKLSRHDFVKALIDVGADTTAQNQTTKEGALDFLNAPDGGNENVKIKQLIIATRLEAFSAALKANEYDQAKQLLSANTIQANDLTQEQQFQCWLACQDVAAIQLLATHKFKIESTDEEGYTPLLYAACLPSSSYQAGLSKREFIQALLDVGANIKALVSMQNSSTLQIEKKGVFDLLQEEDSDVRELLINEKSSRISRNFETFCTALKAGNTPGAAQLIIDKSIEATDLTEEQRFQCWIACRTESAINLLAKNDFKVESKNQEGYTPLLYVVSHFSSLQPPCSSKHDLVAAFLDVGAKPKATTSDGKSVLDLLASNPDDATVKKFVEKHMRS